MPNRRRASVLLLLAVLPLAACGKKGPPQPPLRYNPAATQDLTVRQQGMEIVLEFAYPKTTSAGKALPGLEEVEVWEAVRVLPAGAPDSPLQSLDPREFAATARNILTLRGPELASAVAGDRLRAHVLLASPLPAERQEHIYGVRTIAAGHDRSDPSNQALIAPATPPSTPGGLEVVPRPAGIEIDWTPGTGTTLGYNIYRRDAQARGYGSALHAALPTEKSYLDASAQMGQRYAYSVTAIGNANPSIESALSGEQEVDYQDRFAPPAPQRLVALGDAGRVRLVWEASPAKDVAGYIVFRQDPGQPEFHRITPQPVSALEYLDSGLVAGLKYRYKVAALDRSGNLGEPGEEAEASPSSAP